MPHNKGTPAKKRALHFESIKNLFIIYVHKMYQRVHGDNLKYLTALLANTYIFLGIISLFI